MPEQVHLDLINISDILKDLREGRGMTQRQLAVKMKVAPTTIYNLERGISNPDLKTLFRYAEALGVEMVIAPKKRR